MAVYNWDPVLFGKSDLSKKFRLKEVNGCQFTC